MTDTKRTAERPLSPHLGIYRMTITMLMSIVHRITGGALYFGTLLLAAWLLAVARNRAIDRLRRESSREARHAQAALFSAGDESMEDDVVPDERLRLIFTCCHPALATASQVALKPALQISFSQTSRSTSS